MPIIRKNCWRLMFLPLAAVICLTATSERSASAADNSACGHLDVCGDLGNCGESCTSDYSGPLSGPVVDPEDPIVPDNFEATFEPTTQADALFAGGVEGTLTPQGHAPGYIDWAMPRSQFRMRFDAGWDANRPDRAEFFYAQYENPGPGDLANGVINGRADFQDIRAYLELASGDRFSVFAELPVRFLQTEPAAGTGLRSSGDENGLADMEAGFKYAISNDPTHFLTFQLKTYIPTGNASQGLGTDNVSLEPGLLFQSRINSRLDMFGEVRYWIPINGSKLNGDDYSGQVVRYGLGAAYTAMSNQNVAVSPIVEFVGWSVMDGKFTDDIATIGRGARTTIVNAKVGVRTMFKSNGSTLYVGYGNALTGQRWYEDFLRVEYTIYL